MKLAAGSSRTGRHYRDLGSRDRCYADRGQCERPTVRVKGLARSHSQLDSTFFLPVVRGPRAYWKEGCMPTAPFPERPVLGGCVSARSKSSSSASRRRTRSSPRRNSPSLAATASRTGARSRRASSSRARRRPSTSPRVAGPLLRLVGRGECGGRVAMAATPALVNAVGPHPFWGGRPQPFHVAIEPVRFDMVQLVFRAGADVDGTNDEYTRWSPLLSRSLKGDRRRSGRCSVAARGSGSPRLS